MKQIRLVIATLIIGLMLCQQVFAATHAEYEAEKGPAALCPTPGSQVLADNWNFIACNCTSYVAWRLNEHWKSIAPSSDIRFTNQYRNSEFEGTAWSNANNWGHKAREIGITVDSIPKAGAVGWRDAEEHDAEAEGHVFFVEAVSGSKAILISEYNGDGNLTYQAPHWIHPSKASGYIHFTPSHLDYLKSLYDESDTAYLEVLHYQEECTLTGLCDASGEGGSSDDEDPDYSGSGKIGDANLTINWARIGYEGEPDASCVHELQRTMVPGEVVKIKLCTEIRNKGTGDAINCDLDYRIEDNRDFDDGDTKLHDEEDIDIPVDSTITDCMRNVYVTVSTDGTSVRVNRDDKDRTFPVVDGVAKFYLFVDVEDVGGGGDQDISSQTDKAEYGKMEITVFNPPTANFTASPTSGSVNLTVNFTDQSTGNPTSWYWDFGDGTTSASQNPVHTYTVAGPRTVTLIASNADGSDSETKTNHILITGAYGGYPPGQVTDFGVSTSSADGLTPSFSWTQPSNTDIADPPTGYVLKYDTISGGDNGAYQFEVDLGNVNTYTLPSALSPSTGWYFCLVAYNNEGDGPVTGEVYFSTYDTDGDGLLDGAETYFYGTGADTADTDGDGLSDSDELNVYSTDPNSADSDGDGLSDGAEFALWGSDWNSDADGDGIINLYDPDGDGDGVRDGEDPLPSIFNLHLITSPPSTLAAHVISALQ